MSKITEAEKDQMLAFINTCDVKVRPILRLTVIMGQLFGPEEQTEMLKQLTDMSVNQPKN